MKLIEELKLKEVIKKIRKYKDEHRSIKFFYRDLDNLKLPSLQDFSFKKDDEFFDEVNFILSVIVSIIAHPSLSNKGEDIIVRSELAGHISSDSFQQVCKDNRLWKEKNDEMVPEYVHHYQYTDDIKIYENIFIGMLINLIRLELNKYSEFYASLIPSVESNNDKYLENKIAEKMITKIEALQRKQMFIQNTSFYKEISKCNLHLTKVLPTNILLKNRLYNYCYKFYLQFIKSEDENRLLEELTIYYKYVILKCFKEKNFVLDNTKSQNYNCLSFIYKDYRLKLSLEENIPCINLDISYGSIPAKHHLIINTENKLQMNQFFDYNSISNDLITIWRIYDLENADKPYNNQLVSEKKLVSFWLNSKLQEIFAKKELYMKYCPVCKSKNIENNQKLYTCCDCGSMYTFKDGNQVDTIWFLKLRR